MIYHPELFWFVVVYDIAVLAALGLMAYACVTDLETMTIPNEISAGIAAAFAVAFGAAHFGQIHAFISLKTYVVALGVMFGATFLMFVLKLWGAGDSKLATAAALWVGIKGAGTFLVVMSFTGVALVALSYLFRHLKLDYAKTVGPQSWPVRVQAGERTVPYGIAIAVGAIWSCVSLGYLDLAHLMQTMR